MRIAKVKITENDDLTGSTLRIWMNPSCKFFETIHGHKTVSFWYLTFWIYTFIGRAFCVFSTNFSQRSRSSRRWNLFTHNVIFTDKRDFSSSVSRQFHRHFLLFLDSLEFWFLFLTIFFSTNCFRPISPPFGIALCERFTWSQYEERNNTVLSK